MLTRAWVTGGLAFAPLITGSKLVLPGQHLDGESIYKLMETEGVTVSAGVPTVWQVRSIAPTCASSSIRGVGLRAINTPYVGKCLKELFEPGGPMCAQRGLRTGQFDSLAFGAYRLRVWVNYTRGFRHFYHKDSVNCAETIAHHGLCASTPWKGVRCLGMEVTFRVSTV